MKKKIEPAELTPSEREEMIRLRAENERLKAEIAIVKKEIALREERYAAQRKEKKPGKCKGSPEIVQELHKEGHKLNDLLDVIDLSRSTYYYELGRTDKVKERNAELSSEISTIFNEKKKYGVRQVPPMQSTLSPSRKCPQCARSSNPRRKTNGRRKNGRRWLPVSSAFATA